MWPVAALQTWLSAAGIHRGPVFRRMRRGDTICEQRLTDQSVALIVKRRAQTAGLPTALLPGHSLEYEYVPNRSGRGDPQTAWYRVEFRAEIDLIACLSLCPYGDGAVEPEDWSGVSISVTAVRLQVDPSSSLS